MRARLLSLLLLAVLPCAQASFFGFGRNELEVITNTDVTSDGTLHARPTPERPAYYMAFDYGFVDLGGIVAGDKIPPRKQINDLLAKVLAKQGYLPASNKVAPNIVLAWSWGTLYVDRMPSMNPNLPARQTNRQQMLRFIGGKKANVPGTENLSAFPEFENVFGLNIITPDQSRYIEAAEDDLYVITIRGYDMESFKAKKPKLLWTTRIAAPSRGLVLAETIPAMAAIAGPNIGRETVKPVWISADEKFKAEVLVGPATVVPDSMPVQTKPEQKKN